jgi:hypothetical protein
MTFDIPFYQPLDVRSHGYINRKRENSPWKFPCESSLGICCLDKKMYGTVLDIRCNKTIINLVRVWYDGLSPLESLSPLGQTLWGDNPSYHTLTRLIIAYSNFRFNTTRSIYVHFFQNLFNFKYHYNSQNNVPALSVFYRNNLLVNYTFISSPAKITCRAILLTVVCCLFHTLFSYQSHRWCNS